MAQPNLPPTTTTPPAAGRDGAMRWSADRRSRKQEHTERLHREMVRARKNWERHSTAVRAAERCAKVLASEAEAHNEEMHSKQGNISAPIGMCLRFNGAEDELCVFLQDGSAMSVPLMYAGGMVSALYHCQCWAVDLLGDDHLLFRFEDGSSVLASEANAHNALMHALNGNAAVPAGGAGLTLFFPPPLPGQAQGPLVAPMYQYYYGVYPYAIPPGPYTEFEVVRNHSGGRYRYALRLRCATNRCVICPIESAHRMLNAFFGANLTRVSVTSYRSRMGGPLQFVLHFWNGADQVRATEANAHNALMHMINGNMEDPEDTMVPAEHAKAAAPAPAVAGPKAKEITAEAKKEGKRQKRASRAASKKAQMEASLLQAQQENQALRDVLDEKAQAAKAEKERLLQEEKQRQEIRYTGDLTHFTKQHSEVWWTGSLSIAGYTKPQEAFVSEEDMLSATWPTQALYHAQLKNVLSKPIDTRPTVQREAKTVDPCSVYGIYTIFEAVRPVGKAPPAWIRMCNVSVSASLLLNTSRANLPTAFAAINAMCIAIRARAATIQNNAVGIDPSLLDEAVVITALCHAQLSRGHASSGPASLLTAAVSRRPNGALPSSLAIGYGYKPSLKRGVQGGSFVYEQSDNNLRPIVQALVPNLHVGVAVPERCAYTTLCQRNARLLTLTPAFLHRVREASVHLAAHIINEVRNNPLTFHEQEEMLQHPAPSGVPAALRPEFIRARNHYLMLIFQERAEEFSRLAAKCDFRITNFVKNEQLKLGMADVPADGAAAARLISSFDLPQRALQCACEILMAHRFDAMFGGAARPEGDVRTVVKGLSSFEAASAIASFAGRATALESTDVSSFECVSGQLFDVILTAMRAVSPTAANAIEIMFDNLAASGFSQFGAVRFLSSRFCLPSGISLTSRGNFVVNFCMALAGRIEAFPVEGPRASFEFIRAHCMIEGDDFVGRDLGFSYADFLTRGGVPAKVEGTSIEGVFLKMNAGAGEGTARFERETDVVAAKMCTWVGPVLDDQTAQLLLYMRATGVTHDDTVTNDARLIAQHVLGLMPDLTARLERAIARDNQTIKAEIVSMAHGRTRVPVHTMRAVVEGEPVGELAKALVLTEDLESFGRTLSEFNITRLAQWTCDLTPQVNGRALSAQQRGWSVIEALLTNTAKTAAAAIRSTKLGAQTLAVVLSFAFIVLWLTGCRTSAWLLLALPVLAILTTATLSLISVVMVFGAKTVKRAVGMFFILVLISLAAAGWFIWIALCHRIGDWISRIRFTTATFLRRHDDLLPPHVVLTPPAERAEAAEPATVLEPIAPRGPLIAAPAEDPAMVIVPERHTLPEARPAVAPAPAGHDVAPAAPAH